MYFETFPLYRNVGPPKFFSDETLSSGLASATQELTGWSLGMFDFDNDGHKDLFFATSHFPGSGPRGSSNAQLPNRVLRNLGNGWFDDVSELAGTDFQIPALHQPPRVFYATRSRRGSRNGTTAGMGHGQKSLEPGIHFGRSTGID
jgi:hypothetical protein